MFSGRKLCVAEVATALGDAIRSQLVDVLRKHSGKVCVCPDTISARNAVSSYVTDGLIGAVMAIGFVWTRR
jgi:hypothetical protein